MHASQSRSCTAFAGADCVASGDPQEVARVCKKLVESGDDRILIIFDNATAEPVEMDLRGSLDEAIRRLDASSPTGGAVAAEVSVESRADTRGRPGKPAHCVATPSPRAPGRPKLGVVGREVTLLPRHWEWLNAQPGGASVALRKLVEQARRANVTNDRIRYSREVAFRFMSAMAGNEAGFEEVSRALFAGDRERFDENSSLWPPDVRNYARTLAAEAFPDE